MEYNLGPSTLSAILEKHKIQPHIKWIPVRINDLPPSCDMFVMVLFDDGTVKVELSEDVDWLGAVAFAYVSYSGR